MVVLGEDTTKVTMDEVYIKATWAKRPMIIGDMPLHHLAHMKAKNREAHHEGGCSGSLKVEKV